jgi:hypothetical protein
LADFEGFRIIANKDKILGIPLFFPKLQTFYTFLHNIDKVKYFVPTPKMPPQRQTSRDDRIRCQTLFFYSGFTLDEIVVQLNLTKEQVRDALPYHLIPQKTGYGGKPVLNTLQKKRLVK